MDLIEQARNDPIGVISKKFREFRVIELLAYANDVYRNTGDTVLTDDQYDTIYDLAKARYPSHPFFSR